MEDDKDNSKNNNKNNNKSSSNSTDTKNQSPAAQSSSPPQSSPSPDQSPPPSSSPPPPSSPPPGKSPPPASPPPPSSPPPSSPPPYSPPPSSKSPPPLSPPPPASNPPPPLPPSVSTPNPPPAQVPPTVDSNRNPPPPGNHISNSNNGRNNNNNGNGNGDDNNKNGNNNNKWPPPPPPTSSSSSSNSPHGNGSSRALSPPDTSDGRKKNRKGNDKMPYYNNHHPTAADYYNKPNQPPRPPPTNWQSQTNHGGGGGDPFYNITPKNQNNKIHANDQLHDMPPPPPPADGGGRASEMDWLTPPPSHREATTLTSKDNSNSPYGPTPPLVALGIGQSSFTYEELATATGGFLNSNMLGQGGFGYVHKGTLPDGKEIAVKSLKSGSGQGDREFKAEVEIISRVHHRHLVSLVGYCITGGKKLLVYEYVPNNNLEFHLHGKGQPVMSWPARLKIALGSAKGLAYLHEDCHPRIIHRDIKSSNILLDFSFEPKVADFGLAKLTTDNNTHVSTRVMGTFGYLAPEYASSGKLTEKSDVFSFGVMLLELITGRRPVDASSAMEDSLVDWARPLCLRALEDGKFDEIADPYLEKEYPVEEMARMVVCASASIRHSARRRPKLSQIVRALEGDVSLEDFNNGIKPSQASIFGGGTASLSAVGSANFRSSDDVDNGSYADDLMKLRKIAAGQSSAVGGGGGGTSGAYISSEYGATSEYGLNPSSSSSSEFGSQADESPNVKVRSSFRN